MRRPLLLDLFCGAGGASFGYALAGFDVIGLDLRPQPRYPFPFVRGDAMRPPFDLRVFDAIHASPPCQAYTRLRALSPDRVRPDLLAATRRMLAASGRPWVIENVSGAPLGCAAMLCGSMFGLQIRRHRYFECSELILAPDCRHAGPVVQVNGHPGGSSRRTPHLPRHAAAHWAAAMGIDWMAARELSQAIPPAYTRFIGERLLAAL